MGLVRAVLEYFFTTTLGIWGLDMTFILRALCVVFLAMFVAAMPKAAEAQVTFSKSFSPDTIPSGGTSVLTFTIGNTFVAGGVTDLAFTDTLPAAVTLATPANATNNCPDGTLTAADGGSTITYSGGRLSAGDTCTLSVVVTSSTLGTHNNTSSLLTSNSGSAGPATDDLNVVDTLPTFSKLVPLTPVNVNDPFTVTYRIDNPASASDISTLQLAETFPTGITVAPIPNLSSDCENPTFGSTLTANAGSSTLSLFANGFLPTFPSLAAGASCTISVDLVASTFGTFDLVSGNLLAGGQNAGPSRGRVEVSIPATDGPTLTKRFDPGASGPGGTVQLIFDIVNTSRDSATDIAFTDDLDAFLSGAVSTSGVVSGCGGTLSGAGALTFTGGSLASGASCSFSVNVDIPGTASPATYTNTTSMLTAMVNGATFNGAVASDTLEIGAGTPLDLNISLSPNPVPAGDTTVLSYTITNPNPAVGATDVAFQQIFSGLGAGVTATATPANGSCGAGSVLTFSNGFNPTAPCDPCDGIPAQFNLSGGILPPGGMCTFDVTLAVPADLPGGSYPLQTENVMSDAGTGSAGSTNLVVNGGINLNFTKSFTSGTADAGDIATLEFIIDNTVSTTAVTGLAFTDDLASMVLPGIEFASATANTCGGMATGGFPSTTFGYSGGTVAGGATCRIELTLTVPSNAPTGDYVNTSQPLTGDAGVGDDAAVATLSVLGTDDQPVILSQEFIGGPFLPGEIATLRFSIENPNTSNDATSITFTESLSTALSGLAATGPLPTDPCGAGSLITGTTFLIFVGGNVTAGNSCTFDVPVQIPGGAGSGNFNAVTGNTTAIVNGNVTVGDPASGALVIETALLEITKVFLDDPVIAGNPASMEVIVTNPTSSEITSIGYSDDLTAMLAGASSSGTPSFSGNCGGTGVVPNTTITVSNMTLPAGTSCRIVFAVDIPAGAASGSYPNTINDVSGLVGAVGVSGGVASDSLIVAAADAPTFSKAFSAAAVTPTQTVDLTFTIGNTSTGTVSGIGFNDDLDAMLTGAVATGLPISACGGTLSGTSFLTFTGGSLAGSDSCMFTATVQIPASATPGSYTNTTSGLSVNGLDVTPAATAGLAIEPAPTFAKAFSPSTVREGDTSTLTFTVDNSASGIAASDLAFTDNLPAGMVVATSPNASSTCSGMGDATGGASSFNFAGGNIGAGGSCTIQFDVRATAQGTLINTSGDLISTSGNSGTASATLTVNPPDAPVFTKLFTPSTVDQGQISTLTFTIDNSANNIEGTSMAFTDAFPVGLEVAAVPNVVSDCSGTFDAVAAGTTVGLTGGTVAAASICTIDVDVRAIGSGALPNTTSDLTSTLPDAMPATATLTVNAAVAPGFTKSFTPSTINQGDISVLSFTIDNSANSIEAADLAFTDGFPAGMQLASAPAVSNSCGGSITANAGDTSVSLSGGLVDAGASCVIDVSVQGILAGSLDNATSGLTSTLPTARPATATLIVDALPLNASISFVPSTIEQFLTSTLTYTFTNVSLINGTALTLNDTLPAGVVIATPANASTTCRDGTLTVPDGGGAVSYTGGSVAASFSCSISVDVTSDIVGSYPNTTENITSSLGVSAAASATLTVDPSSTGTITIVQNTDTDGPYEFTSNASELNFTINTAGGTGQFGPTPVIAGSYVVNQLAPAGVGTSAISCTDADSSGDARSGSLTINIAALEAVTCTFTSISSQQKTVDTINRFLTKRADLILSSEPSNSRRIDRLKRGAGNASALRFANGDVQSFLPFTAQISTASENYTMSTSLLQVRQAAASLALGHGAQNDVRYVPNYRWDAWFEAQYKKFDSGPDEGHFAIAYFGADYLVTPDLLIGAMLQIDDMEDSSSSLNSSVSGTGWMAGPYMTARIGPNLYFDGRIAAGTSTNDISPFNTYEDEFTTDRWMATAGLTGDFQRGDWTIQPGASLSYFEEKQHTYVDGVGVTIPSQVVSLGQVKIGPTFTGQFQTPDGMNYSPFFSLDAIYNFGDTKGVITTNPDTASTDGWRGRIQTGIDFSLQNGTQISFGSSYDGIGRGSLDVWGLSFELSIPIQKASAK